MNTFGSASLSKPSSPTHIRRELIFLVLIIGSVVTLALHKMPDLMNGCRMSAMVPGWKSALGCTASAIAEVQEAQGSVSTGTQDTPQQVHGEVSDSASDLPVEPSGSSDSRTPSIHNCKPGSFMFYNRPPKTGSNVVRDMIEKLERTTGGSTMFCEEYDGYVENSLSRGLPKHTQADVLWQPKYSAATCHVGGHNQTKIREDVKRNSGREVCFITSTREPRARITSQYLQYQGMKSSSLVNDATAFKRFEEFLGEFDVFNLLKFHGLTGTLNPRDVKDCCAAIPKLDLYSQANAYARFMDFIIENKRMEDDLELLRKVRYPSEPPMPRRSMNSRATEEERAKILDKAGDTLFVAACAEMVLHTAFVGANVERRERGEL